METSKKFLDENGLTTLCNQIKNNFATTEFVNNTISELTTRLNALADSDDTTLDQLSEIVAYIKNNRSLINAAIGGTSSIKTAMDEIAVAGTQYYLGEQTSVSIVLPDDAKVGQMVTVSWYNGETAATLSITGTMLSFDYTPSANTRSEINALWDRRYWAVLGNEMAVPSAVTA